MYYRIGIFALYDPFESYVDKKYVSGGIEAHARNIALALASKGIDVYLFTLGKVPKPTLRRIKEVERVHVWVLPDYGRIGIFSRMMTLVTNWKLLLKLIKVSRVKILIGEGGHASLLCIFKLMRKLPIERLYLFVHTLDGEEIANIKDFIRLGKRFLAFKEALKYLLLKLYRALYLSVPDALIFVSNAVLYEFIRYYRPLSTRKGQRVYIVGNGTQDLVVSQLNFNYDDIKFKNIDFIYVGRVDKRKGVDLIIHASCILKKHRLEPKIIIIGDGLYLDYCKRLTSKLRLNNIEFLGYLKEKEKVYEYILKAKFFIMPSFYEGDPIIVKEVLSLGVPVIASNILALRQLIQDGINGFLFREGDYLDLADKMKKALSITENNYIVMSRNALNSVGNRSWADVAEELLSIIKGTLDYERRYRKYCSYSTNNLTISPYQGA